MEIVKHFKEEFLDLEMGTSTVKSLEEELLELNKGFRTVANIFEPQEKALITVSLFLHIFFLFAFGALDFCVPAFSKFTDTQKVLGEAISVYLIFSPFIFAHYYYINKYRKYRGELLPVIFTIYSSYAVGFTYALMNGKWVRESAVFTAAAITIVRFFICGGDKNRRDSTVPTRIIFGGIVVLLVFLLVQIIFPLEKLKMIIYDHDIDS